MTQEQIGWAASHGSDLRHLPQMPGKDLTMPRHRSLRLRIRRLRVAHVRRVARGAIRRPECSDFLRLVLRGGPHREYQIYRAGEIFISAIRGTEQ